MKLAVDHLPKTARMIADVIGLPATLVLVQHFGGLSFWPSRYGGGRAHLAELIGEEAAEKLVTTFREQLSVPKCEAAVRAVLHDELRAEFDALTGDGSSARSAVTRLASKYRYTERNVWRLLKQAGSCGEVMGTRQTELF